MNTLERFFINLRGDRERGITPIIKKLQKIYDFTYRITNNCRCSRGYYPYENL